MGVLNVAQVDTLEVKDHKNGISRDFLIVYKPLLKQQSLRKNAIQKKSRLRLPGYLFMYEPNCCDLCKPAGWSSQGLPLKIPL